MKKSILGLVLCTLFLILVFGFFRLSKLDSSNDNTNNTSISTILFVGEGCPHCAKVKEYISQNQIEQKIPLEIREVYYNKQNNQLLKEKAAVCGYSNYGVPFLWDNNTCTVGDQPIIDFLNNKLNKT